MLDYSIGEFYGILLTFGILVFLSLIGLKIIFGIVDESFGGSKNTIFHYHHHWREGYRPRRDKNL